MSAANREARLARSKRLLKEKNSLLDSDVHFMWFTDEKIFIVATPQNPQIQMIVCMCRLRQKRDCTRASATNTLDFQQVADGAMSVGVSK